MRYSIKFVVLIALFGFFRQPAKAQIWLSDKAIYDEAEAYLNSEEYIEALPLYMLLEKKDLLTANICYKIGECYLNIRGQKYKSIPYLETAVQNISSDFKEDFSEIRAPLKALLLLGVAYRIDNQPKKAISVFEQLKDSIRERDPDFLEVIDMHINRCENAILLNAFPNEPRTEKLPPQINDEFSNYNPVLVDHDSVLFYMEQLKFYDALMRVENSHGEWGNPQNLTPSIGSDGDHILVDASADGKTLFLYIYVPMKAGEIYTTSLTNGRWSEMKPLNKNINTQYNETHASLSADGRTLYFTSNRPGGYGGLDIYKSKLDNNNDWGPAVNLGPVINTPFDEETPFMNSDDELLYFSSQGHLSMGGFDVFYSLKMGDNKWHEPVNMGAPVCTTDDDLFYFPLEEEVSGLMSRLEPPYSSGYDIYRFNSMTFANTPRFNVKGKVNNIDSTNYTDYSVALVYNQTNDTLIYSNVGPDGNYEFLLPAGDFSLVILNKASPLRTIPVTINENTPETTYLARVEKTAEVVIAKQQEEVKKDTLTLRPVYFAFNGYKLQPSCYDYLDHVKDILIKYPGLILQVEGYTDAIGPEDYNQSLSVKRARSVADNLLLSNIESKRLIVTGEGENNPVALNTNPDGTDNPSGRKYNRRVILVPETTIDRLYILQINDVPDNLRVKDR
jgi:outer membrane protein OmpA-like peptidoglycan-associated protein/tetratricopeptide (TPR) repeat protein